MSKGKLIIHERFEEEQSLEDIMISIFESEFIRLSSNKKSIIMKSTEASQDSFCCGKGA